MEVNNKNKQRALLAKYKLNDTMFWMLAWLKIYAHNKTYYYDFSFLFAAVTEEILFSDM